MLKNLYSVSNPRIRNQDNPKKIPIRVRKTKSIKRTSPFLLIIATSK